MENVYLVKYYNVNLLMKKWTTFIQQELPQRSILIYPFVFGICIICII